MQIDISRVSFTDHALQQFVKRFELLHGQKLTTPEKTARKLLAKAKEDDILDAVARTKRLIDNGFKVVSYFLNSGWRFVVKEEGDNLVVLTIERAFGNRR